MNSPCKILIFEENQIIVFGLKKIIQSFCSEAKIHDVQDFKEILQLLNKEAFDLLIIGKELTHFSIEILIKSLEVSHQDIKTIFLYTINQDNFTLPSNLNLSFYDRSTNVKYLTNLIGNFFTENTKIRNGKKKDIQFLSLSSREIQIAKLLLMGYGNLEIAAELSIKNSTVSTYKKRIFNKLKVTNVVQLAQVFKEDDDVLKEF